MKEFLTGLFFVLKNKIYLRIIVINSEKIIEKLKLRI